MTIHLGLTGSIGMGKTTTAKLFADRGYAVWDADAAVARLYQKDGLAVPEILEEFPNAVVKNAVSKEKLKEILLSDPSQMEALNKIVHPLVKQDRDVFRSNVTSDIAIYDIPLLFELGSQQEFDATICVYTTQEIQKARVMSRGTMTTEEYELVLAKQMPTNEKIVLSDYQVRTDTFETAKKDVDDILSKILS